MGVNQQHNEAHGIYCFYMGVSKNYGNTPQIP